MTNITINVKQLPHAEGLALPAYQSAGAAGMDVMAALAEPVYLAPGARTAIPTGLSISVPAGYEAQIRPRSGLAFRHGLTVVNAPGTIDSDYRGEIKILLINLGAETIEISHGMRIAQMVIAPVVQASLQEVDSLSGTDRGAGGFGSTGS